VTLSLDLLTRFAGYRHGKTHQNNATFFFYSIPASAAVSIQSPLASTSSAPALLYKTQNGVLRETKSGMRELQVSFPSDQGLVDICPYWEWSRKLHKKVINTKELELYS